MTDYDLAWILVPICFGIAMVATWALCHWKDEEARAIVAEEERDAAIDEAARWKLAAIGEAQRAGLASGGTIPADRDLDEAARSALEGGEAAPIEDVLAALRGPGRGIREIPIRTLGDVARDAKAASFGDLGRDPHPADLGAKNVLRARAGLPLKDMPSRDPYPSNGAPLPDLTWRFDGLQPDEAVLEIDGTWTLRRRAPSYQLPLGHPLPFEERGLSDQVMIDRGFDLDALLADLPVLPEPGPIRIDLVPRDRRDAS